MKITRKSKPIPRKIVRQLTALLVCTIMMLSNFTLALAHDDNGFPDDHLSFDWLLDDDQLHFDDGWSGEQEDNHDCDCYYYVDDYDYV